MIQSQRRIRLAALARAIVVVFLATGVSAGSQASSRPEFLRTTSEAGQPGGRLIIAEATEPKTFNPVTVIDRPSRDVVRRMTGDLIHINRETQRTEPALAKSWTASRDGKTFTLRLRRGIKFSDGVPFDADDVVFSFQVYLDEKIDYPQRSFLFIHGKPLQVQKLGPYTVRFSFVSPYAAAERLFDSVAMLPRHLLEQPYKEGKLNQAWGLDTPPDKMAGLGPFRVKQVVPGQRIVLERNQYYWKIDSKGQKLPYLDELVFVSIPSRDAQVVRFQAGEVQVLESLTAENFLAMEPEQKARHYKLYDVGPGLEYNFLLFNLNRGLESKLPEIARKQTWFRDVRFRQAISYAIDRAAIVRLVYQGKGAPLATLVTPGEKLWLDSSIPIPEHSVAKARQLLQSAGFSWKADGALVDSGGKPVEFTILASASNAQRAQMATLIQQDLKSVGISVHAVTLEFRSMVQRITDSHDYEAAIMGLAGGDSDPNEALDTLSSSGSTHLWALDEKPPLQPWQAQVDELMQKQLITMNYPGRKKVFDQVQQIVAREQPAVFLASPHILVAAHEGLGNIRPAIIENYLLWNSDEIFWRTPAGKR
ncbi:MAG TPA: ABC transporter substrate-binding protein [Candidatus Angelobacter sp.]|nr:ABC transporter substrate-binding protein [Candidatus Angelobacter sp.]